MIKMKTITSLALVCCLAAGCGRDGGDATPKTLSNEKGVAVSEGSVANKAADSLAQVIDSGWTIEEIKDEMTGKTALVATQSINSGGVETRLSWICTQLVDVNGDAVDLHGTAIVLEVFNGDLVDVMRDVDGEQKVVSLARFRAAETSEVRDIQLVEDEAFSNQYSYGVSVSIQSTVLDQMATMNVGMGSGWGTGFGSYVSSRSIAGKVVDDLQRIRQFSERENIEGNLADYKEKAFSGLKQLRVLEALPRDGSDREFRAIHPAFYNSATAGEFFDIEKFLIEVRLNDGSTVMFRGDKGLVNFFNRCVVNKNLPIFEKSRDKFETSIDLFERALIDIGVITD